MTVNHILVGLDTVCTKHDHASYTEAGELLSQFSSPPTPSFVIAASGSAALSLLFVYSSLLQL